MIFEIIGWAAVTLSLIGIVLNAKQNSWCWLIWLASNILWVARSIHTGDLQSCVVWVVFAVFNVYGAQQWHKIEMNKTKGQW